MEKEQETKDVLCEEDDGCPTEKAVLQRQWREQRRELQNLRARVAELESERDIEKHNENLTHEANKRMAKELAYVENDYAICKHSLERLKHDLILKNAQLAACEKERDEAWIEFKSLSERAGANLSPCEKKLAASQHYAQQLRDALEAIESDQCCAPFLKAREALSIPHDTSALDTLVKDAERYQAMQAEAERDYIEVSTNVEPYWVRFECKEALDEFADEARGK